MRALSSPAARALRLTLTPVALTLCSAAPGIAQLPSTDALALGRGGEAALTPEAGLSGSPAALAGAQGWAGTILPFEARLGLGPITGRDLARTGDDALSAPLREGWLQRVERTGSQTGGLHTSITALALRRGNLSLQLSTVGTASMVLAPGAVELLLFGNAGRTGDPADLKLAGSVMEGALVSTAGIGWGVHLRPELSVGLRGHLSIGHAALVGRDGGTLLDEDAGVAVRFPTLSGVEAGRAGFGVGLDAGVRWVTVRSATEITLYNAASTFEWSLDALEWRPGETLIRGNGVESDFDPRPGSTAPLLLRAQLGDMVPAARLEIEHIHQLSPNWSLRGTFREVLGEGLDLGRASLRAVGGEWSGGRSEPGSSAPAPFTFATHLGSTEGRLQMGIGGRVGLGGWLISAGWTGMRAKEVNSSLYAFSFSYSGGT